MGKFAAERAQKSRRTGMDTPDPVFGTIKKDRFRAGRDGPGPGGGGNSNQPIAYGANR